jgi:hypothetical protein
MKRSICISVALLSLVAIVSIRWAGAAPAPGSAAGGRPGVAEPVGGRPGAVEPAGNLPPAATGGIVMPPADTNINVRLDPHIPGGGPAAFNARLIGMDDQWLVVQSGKDVTYIARDKVLSFTAQAK